MNTNFTGNCNALFVANCAVGDENFNPDEPLASANDLARLGSILMAGDYEGFMQLTIIESGDVLDIEVSFHVTEDGLVDIEAL